MRTPFFLALACPALATAAIEVPHDAYDHEQIAEARAEAEEEGKGLTFVLTDPGTS